MPARSARSENAIRLLHKLFAPLDVPMAIRLWDGATSQVGAPGIPAFALVFRSRRALRRLLRRPTARAFGEAFIDEQIDLDGDLLAAMRATHHMEATRIPLRTRIGLLMESVRI